MRPYLTAEQVNSSPLGVEYKKKSMGGGIIFRKTQFRCDGKKCVVELASKNGIWFIQPEEIDRVYRRIGLTFQSSTNDMDGQTLHQLKVSQLRSRTGWDGFAAFSDSFSSLTPEWKRNLTREKYLELYSDYPDPVELHYFDQDSPEYIRIRNILNAISPNQMVLDVGCNSGYVGEVLLQKKCQVFGVDINSSLVHMAKRKGINASVGWAEELPYSSESFDVVVMGYLLEHVLAPEKVLDEAHRVLKPDGKLVGSVPTEYGDWGEQNVPVHLEHLRFYTKSSLEEALNRAGFVDILTDLEIFRGRDLADSYFFTCKKGGTHDNIQ